MRKNILEEDCYTFYDNNYIFYVCFIVCLMQAKESAKTYFFMEKCKEQGKNGGYKKR